MPEYIGVYLVDLPHGIRGYSRRNEDGGYSIFINARLNTEMQCQAYDHEIAHISAGDFNGEAEVDLLECARHPG